MATRAVVCATLTACLAVLTGCHHDKYNLAYTPKEEMILPPDEPRFNNPPEEKYKKPKPRSEDTSLMGGGRGGPGKMGGPVGGPGQGF